MNEAPMFHTSLRMSALGEQGGWGRGAPTLPASAAEEVPFECLHAAPMRPDPPHCHRSEWAALCMAR
eukprot:364166-Chlamydomonas_euryale.AAC.5